MDVSLSRLSLNQTTAFQETGIGSSRVTTVDNACQTDPRKNTDELSPLEKSLRAFFKALKHETPSFNETCLDQTWRRARLLSDLTLIKEDPERMTALLELASKGQVYCFISKTSGSDCTYYLYFDQKNNCWEILIKPSSEIPEAVIATGGENRNKRLYRIQSSNPSSDPITLCYSRSICSESPNPVEGALRNALANSPYVEQLSMTLTTAKKVARIMALRNTDLNKIFTRYDLSFRSRQEICHSAAKGIEAIHNLSLKIGDISYTAYHGDVSPDNYLADVDLSSADVTVRIHDLNNSGRPTWNLMLKPFFIAPEYVKARKHLDKDYQPSQEEIIQHLQEAHHYDIWALGITFCCILSHQTKEQLLLKHAELWNTGKYYALRDLLIAEALKDAPDDSKETWTAILKGMLEPEFPERRWTIQKVLSAFD